ncbi:MAG: 3-dehydroquinate synthase [Gemmatimonadaceae bacterium]
MHKVELDAYSVSISPGSLSFVGHAAREVAPAHRYIVVSDSGVARLYGNTVLRSFDDDQVDVLTIPPGEKFKTRDSWATITDWMLQAGCGRDTTIIALGGGVVGDLAGFVAATFMRGIPYIQVPTTLLAMIDASIGGKTAVDTPAGKNLVGVFHPPAAVLVDTDTLATLPENELRAGFAEAIKHGVIADASYFERLANKTASLVATPADPVYGSVVARSVAIKADIVQQDPREDGLRKVLNFGHTLGHAIETASDYGRLHGECVAIGMSLEGAIAERIGVAEPGVVTRIRGALSAAGLPTELPADLDPRAVLALTRSDKKARAGVAEYALPRRIGEMARAGDRYALPVEEALVLEVLTGR